MINIDMWHNDKIKAVEKEFAEKLRDLLEA